MGLIPGLAWWVKDLALLWLWCRLTATALILPLAWELAHVMGAALKGQEKKKRAIYKKMRNALLSHKVCREIGAEPS